MTTALVCDETLLQRLPLPLAQLYRRAGNAKTAGDRHLTAYYLWEAGLTLLGAVAVVAYAEQPHPDPELTERLQNLARPGYTTRRRTVLPRVGIGLPRPSTGANSRSTSLPNRDTGQDSKRRLPPWANGCAPVRTTDPDLARVVTAWPTLPNPIRRAGLALIESEDQTPLAGGDR